MVIPTASSGDGSVTIHRYCVQSRPKNSGYAFRYRA